MQVQAEGGQIPWIGHLKRPCHYGSDKGLQSYRVADPNEGQGGPVLPWLCELLSEVYLQLLQYHPPPPRCKQMAHTSQSPSCQRDSLICSTTTQSTIRRCWLSCMH